MTSATKSPQKKATVSDAAISAMARLLIEIALKESNSKEKD